MYRLGTERKRTRVEILIFRTELKKENLKHPGCVLVIFLLIDPSARIPYIPAKHLYSFLSKHYPFIEKEKSVDCSRTTHNRETVICCPCPRSYHSVY